MTRQKRKGESKALNVKIDLNIYNELDYRSIIYNKTKAVLTENALKEYFERHPRHTIDFEEADRQFKKIELSNVEFLKKSENKIIENDVRVSVMGTSRSRIIKFSFNKESLELISNTGYISVSKVKKDTNIIYFNESHEKNGFKIRKTIYGGVITVANRFFAETISATDWEGDYKLEVDKNYFCIKKDEWSLIRKDKT